MNARLNYTQYSADTMKHLLRLGSHVENSGLEHSLLELVKTRASQINGCAFCIDMHTKDARASGETEQRLYLLNAWREAPFYTERERAALAWTEAVTLVNQGVSNDAYAEVNRHFTEQEVVNLTWAIVTINAWNRLAISFHALPGSYQPGQPKVQVAAHA